MPPLKGIIGAPVLRRDGTLLQKPGYDPATGFYLASRVRLDPVPDERTAAQVRAARSFLLEKFLRDFPGGTGGPCQLCWLYDINRARGWSSLALGVIAGCRSTVRDGGGFVGS